MLRERKTLFREKTTMVMQDGDEAAVTQLVQHTQWREESVLQMRQAHTAVAAMRVSSWRQSWISKEPLILYSISEWSMHEILVHGSALVPATCLRR